MILHCVFLRFLASVTAQQKQDLYAAIAALQAKIPGIVDVRCGANMSPEGLDHGFQDGFTVTFESADARDAYLVHPEHVTVGQQIVAAMEGGLNGIFVFDLAV